MLKKLTLAFGLSTNSFAEPIDLNLVLQHEVNLRYTQYFSVADRFKYLELYSVPKPYPNMFMGYMSPDEAITTFICHLKNRWDDDKTFSENWVEGVTEYNKKHHSLPIPIR